MIVTWKKQSTRRKANRDAFRLTQIPHCLAWDLTRGSATDNRLKHNTAVNILFYETDRNE